MDDNYRPPTPSKNSDDLPRQHDPNSVPGKELPPGILKDGGPLRRSPSRIFDNTNAKDR